MWYVICNCERAILQLESRTHHFVCFIQFLYVGVPLHAFLKNIMLGQVSLNVLGILNAPLQDKGANIKLVYIQHIPVKDNRLNLYKAVTTGCKYVLVPSVVHFWLTKKHISWCANEK